MNLDPILNRIPAAWGKWVEVGAGWYPIVLNLNDKLAALDPNYEIHQVKQKFGGLRFYCSLDGHPEAVPLIQAAEAQANTTCENCGQPGQARGGSWIWTLCDTCAAQKKATP